MSIASARSGSSSPRSTWNITARLAGPLPPEFDAKLLKRDGANVKIGNEAEANTVLDDLKQATWTVASVTTKERKKGAVPPFITSKLQQASRFPVKKTMMIAQQLYEGIELPGEGAVGLITYMRTDSTRVADQALTDVREFIGQKFGPDYLPEKAIYYKTKADAQDAHEAIRPTSMQYHPDVVRGQLTPDQYYLYRLIWNRFVASQMPAATFDETIVDVEAAKYLFRVKGSVPKFAGWMAVYNQEPAEDRTAGPGPDATSADEEDGANVLPVLNEGDRLELRALKPEQKFTQPPPRYSEATLVKALEENGIGRPSTYALDHRRHPDARVREQDRSALQADAARHDARREAAQPGVRRHPRRQLHARARRGARQDRRRDQRLQDRARRASTRSSKRI